MTNRASPIKNAISNCLNVAMARSGERLEKRATAMPVKIGTQTTSANAEVLINFLNAMRDQPTIKIMGKLDAYKNFEKKIRRLAPLCIFCSSFLCPGR